MIDLLALMGVFFATDTTFAVSVSRCFCAYFSIGSGSASVHITRVLAGDFRLKQAGIHIELHLLGKSTRMVNNLIVFDGLVAGVLPLTILPRQTVTDFCHVPNLFDQVV